MMFVDAPARYALVFGDTSKAINEFGRVDHSLHRARARARVCVCVCVCSLHVCLMCPVTSSLPHSTA